MQAHPDELGSSLTIPELAKICHRVAAEKGWYDTGRSFGDIIALIHSELSEALDEWRFGHPIDQIRYVSDSRAILKPEGVAVEFADVLIRILDTCEAMGIPLLRAIVEKIAYNEKRPYRHGGKLA